MGAFVRSGGHWQTAVGDHNPNITPDAGDLLVVAALHSGYTGAVTVSDDQAGGTYSEVTIAGGSPMVKNASADSARLFVRDALVTAGATLHTVTIHPTGTTTGGGGRTYEFSGMTRTGTAAIRQTAKQDNQASGGTPAPAFASAALTGNMTGAIIHNGTNPATVTPPTGWTEDHDSGYSTPTSGFEAAFRDSGFTGTTVTWGSTSGSAFGSLIWEMDTSAASTPSLIWTPRQRRIMPLR